MARKFNVQFEIETDDDGFQYPPSGRRVKRAFGLSGRPYPAALVPDHATITEITPLGDGYYYGASRNNPNSRFLFKRDGGVWYFRSISDTWAEMTLVDDDMREYALRVGPLREDL